MQKLYSFPSLQMGMIIILCFTTMIVWVLSQSIIKYRTSKSKKFAVAVCIALVVFIGSAIFLFGMFLSALDIRETMSKRSYSTVTGYITGYDLSTEGGHTKEKFQVAGVQFEYSSSELTWYYCTTQSAGGVIRGNGQYVEIQYVKNSKGRNQILSIAENSSKSQLESTESEYEAILTRAKVLHYLILSVLFVGLALLVRRIYKTWQAGRR